MTEMDCLQPSLNGVLPDVLFLQNLPSQLTAHVLNPRPGSRVLDMCAAPGGKTTHLAQLMRNEGELLAADKNAKKAAKIIQNCARFGIEIVQVSRGDSRFLFEEGEKFDHILLDPPCSGLGQRPSFLLPTAPLRNLPSFPAHQRELFGAAWKRLKPTGTLLYSTCTVNPAENELMVAWILKTIPEEEIELLPIRQGDSLLRQLSQPGLLVEGLSGEQCESSLCRFWPDEEHDSIGFFFCKFLKKEVFD
jgi:16S rRNA C967 or C1407 C5-methylase (RsmB/RsmF family)